MAEMAALAAARDKRAEFERAQPQYFDRRGAFASGRDSTVDKLPRRMANFATLGEALDYAARGVRGMNFTMPAAR
jgi:hypothetical protein